MSFTVHPGHKVGLVGKNGVGKSTVFDLIRSRLLPDEGDVIVPPTWQIAWLDQQKSPSERPALEYVMDGDGCCATLSRRINQALEMAKDAPLAALYNRT